MARVKLGLSVLADNAAADVDDSDVRTHTVVRVIDEVIVDLMAAACGLRYADVARDAVSRELQGVSIPVASPATLIQTKDRLRPQDAVDGPSSSISSRRADRDCDGGPTRRTPPRATPLLGVTAIACSLPARTLTRIDPVQVSRIDQDRATGGGGLVGDAHVEQRARQARANVRAVGDVP